MKPMKEKFQNTRKMSSWKLEHVEGFFFSLFSHGISLVSPQVSPDNKLCQQVKLMETLSLWTEEMRREHLQSEECEDNPHFFSLS